MSGNPGSGAYLNLPSGELGKSSENGDGLIGLKTGSKGQGKKNNKKIIKKKY